MNFSFGKRSKRIKKSIFPRMQQLPKITPNRLAIKLKANTEKLVKQGHPWIFTDSIAKQNKDGRAGDIAILFDQRKDAVFAVGLYDPESPIRIKVISSQPAKPTPLFLKIRSTLPLQNV